MEDTKIVVCRLCLNFTTFDECQILDTVSKDMLTFIMPETDLDISHDPKICQTCYKTMLRCYRFKSNYNKDIKTDTKKKLDTEGSEMISIQVEEVESKCNFCSSSIDDESREEFSNHKTYFTEVLQKYLPERNLSSKALFCKKCLDDLTSQFTFITKCTDTENKLKDYRLTHGTNSEGKLNLYEALQQILCKEDTDLITAIKTDGDMSCEDLFEEANNEVPFPEVDVKTETLNMEEVDIKSEPYDEESIITSESEGSITGSERHLEKSQAESFDSKEPAAHDDYKDHSENPLNISQFNVETVKFQQTSPLSAVRDELCEVKPKDHSNLDHNFIKEESPEANDRKTQLTEADRTEKNKNARRRNFCYFCKTAVSNFARHITKKHVTEIEVRKILLQPANSKERKILINTLRKKGNFFKNSAEVCINPMRKSILPNRSYLPCPYCLGYYSAKLLYRHKKKCTEKLPSDNHLNVYNTRTKNIPKVNVKKAGLTEDNKMEKNETINQGHFCCFCETEVFNFARHITRNHRTQAEVQEILSKPTNTKERKILINILRKRGNFLKHSKQDCFKPMRKSMLPNKTYLPCPNCLGFYSAKLLYRHKNNCTGNSNAERISQSSAQNRLVAHLKIDKQLKELVFPRMRPDNVSLEAKKDALICAFGASYLKVHLKKHFINVISRKMRELSKILTEMKKKRPSIENMFQALQPEYYDTLVEASKIVARYDTEKDIFGAPTLAMNISASLKHCCNVAISFALQKPRTDEAETKLKTTMQLLKTNWKFDMSICRAGGDPNRNKLRKVTIVSLAGDLKLLKDYLEKVANEALSNVTNNNNDVEGYVTLLETVLCRTVLVNRRCPKLLQKIPLRTYEQCENTEQSMDEFEDTFSRLEKILWDKFKCVVIRGKRGRVVPVLICTDTQEHIKILIESRPNFVGKENPYLFGMPNLKIPICGYAVLKKYAKACGATKHKSITSRPLRKYVATLSQLFLMDENEVERLANFMGRSIHSSHDDVQETAKLSKLLLLMESGDASEYKGKSLDEIDIDLEEDLLEDDSDSSGESDDDIISYNDLMPRRETKTPPPVIKKQKRVLVPWSAEQKKIVKEFFKSHIKNRKPPKRGECDELVSRYPEILCNKSWEKIKVFIQNVYTKKTL